MAEVGVRELKQRASELLRRVREGRETIDITYRGKVVAQRLELFAQLRIVEHEPRRFLHHPQRFSGAIGVGI